MVLLAVVMFLGMVSFPTEVDATTKVCVKKTILPYRQLMTPQWIADNAVITGPFDVDPQYFQISPPNTGPRNQIALQVQMVPPGILKANDNVSITIIIAMDIALADSADHDPRSGVSDGTNFVGFTQLDRDNFDANPPCQLVEGDKSNGELANLREINGPLVSSNQFSGEYKMQFRPSERWGSCHTEHEEGYTNIANYQRLLDPSNGLYLEMYHHDPTETYRIKYITANVELD